MKVTFLGLGVMGKYMAANLGQSGKFHSVKVWNRSYHKNTVKYLESHGCTYCKSPIDACIEADIVCLCVSDASAVKDILFGKQGIVNSLRKQTPIIDFSTIGQTATIDIYNQLQQKQIPFIDAPVSGGDIGAKNGTLTVMVGSTKHATKQLIDVFNAVGKQIFYCDSIGNGQLVKSANQILCAIHMVAICEAFQFAESRGLDKNLVVDVCSTGAAGSWALKNLGSQIAQENFDPGFMIKHMIKDLGIVDETKPKDLLLKCNEYARKKFQEVQKHHSDALGTQAMYLSFK